jgi:bifunctional non-homologous end joining protein LigD
VQSRSRCQQRLAFAELLDGGTDALMFSSNVAGFEGLALFRHACAMGLKGIVSKRLGTPYRSGRRAIKRPGYRRP